MTTDKLKPAKQPCGSCPYRRDVPSGIWSAKEYDKLPIYDAPILDQILARAGVFLCHQKDGHLCAGWLACHGDNLATLRIGWQKYDPSTFTYATDVPVFASGAEAREHGLRDIAKPGVKANKMMSGLIRKGAAIYED
jgi:hypothetical protein